MENNWIRTRVKQPTRSDRYLVALHYETEDIEYTETYIRYFDVYRGWEVRHAEVVAWMELPQYEGEDDSEL